ncbi:MAG: glutaminyl-tRNA synthase (glutamine-hydrolyzing) subunit B [Candidatus Buchananbacteria bacterium RBG_13_36_9]|uniref:Aspartyl/glutamyl-tRNA(Asn/Gln) amidotransferase subunit B n=1 Tax=Candidatus Buchananbacteria bacterium RBG_13_36_9 TaxID=1797530 RepID=A0A1G1XQ95_9BACT|nr:MAG: glutaminyl-tRNA synthase (glutamine-hydrolyzing) subunit B [Candidatus Buchananbacteria bacterium RBG_13_36_9]
MELEPIIGLEIHVQLKTKSKMFCTCDNGGENLPPNSCVCPICLAHPGTLPIANKQAIEWSALAALALNCTISEYSKFDRKHYYYPDLPKAYQISQYDQPIGKNGYLYILNPEKNEEEKIGINRIHLEEDAAKLLHPEKKNYSLIDFNRGGTPLMEIVSEPDIKTPVQAKLFLQELRQIMRYLDISEADMEKGHLRCDANISLKPVGEEKLYPKTEIKNLNSFKMVEKALEYEINRQTKLWLEGNPPKDLTTRGWNDAKGITEEQRIKEEAHDYRYFPEPDIPPIHFLISPETACDKKEIAIDIVCLRTKLPELPNPKRKRFMAEFDLNYDEVKILTEDKANAAFYEQVISELKEWIESLEEAKKIKNIWEENKPKLTKLASNLIINNLIPLLADNNIDIETMKMTPENMAELITWIFSKKITNNTALQILPKMIKTGADPSHLIKEGNLAQISDSKELEVIIKEIIAKNPKPVDDYKKGKERALGALIGLVMAKTHGKANPEKVMEIMRNLLKP